MRNDQVSGTQQLDLLMDQMVDGAPFKDDRALMEHPWFSLTKQPRKTPFEYKRGGVEIVIDPGAKGMATIWDYDLLMYISSIINDKLERGIPIDPNRKIRFAAYDLLKSTGRQTSKRGYDLFIDALDRLDGTRIRTNVESAKKRTRKSFGWIESYTIHERKTKNGKTVMAAVEVTLNEWMFNAIVVDRRVLSINPQYFDLSRGIARRIYQLSRKHCGNQSSWLISLSSLKQKCGSDREERKFRADVKQIIDEGGIPDYVLRLEKSRNLESPFKSRNPNEWMLEVRPLRPRSDELPAPDVDTGVGEADQQLLPGTKTVSARPKKLHIEVMERARERYPGWDIERIEREWMSYTESRGQVLKNPEKAFFAFADSWVKNRSVDA